MEKVYIPQREKHYTLEDWMIRFVINCSIKEWMEILGDDDWGAELSDMDLLLGRGRRSSKNTFDSCLNQLNDENLCDILLLEGIGEDHDVDLTLDPGEERFLDYYRRHPDMIVDRRTICLHFIEDRRYLPAAIRIGQMLLELPKGSDISRLPADLFDWDEGVSDEEMRKLIARDRAMRKKEEEASDGE